VRTNIIIDKKKWKLVKVACCIVVVLGLFRGYLEVGLLSLKYGYLFDEGYKQSGWFSDYPYMKPRVLRFRNFKATVYTDSRYIKEKMEDKRENIALINYGGSVAMCFIYDGNNWILDTSGGYEDFIMLNSSTADNVVWPLYLW